MYCLTAAFCGPLAYKVFKDITMEFKNDSNISLALAVFLATDDYDHEDDVISVTSLMKSTRQLVLASRMPPTDGVVDVASLVSSRMGTAIHDAIEKSWLNPTETLKALGHPKRVYENIVINPTAEEIKNNPKAIPIYMEQRSYKEIEGIKVSGKFDFVGEGMVQDFKSTSVWNYMNQNSVESYKKQLSLYRWLNPEIITKDRGLIHYLFTDWSAMQARSTKLYPESRVFTQAFSLMSLEESESFVRQKILAFKKYKEVTEDKIPLCTDEDLWRKEAKWKYYKDPNKLGRSTKNFDTQSEALNRFVDDGSIGIVKEVPGQVVKCKYCNAFSICSQKDSLIEKGELIL